MTRRAPIGRLTLLYSLAAAACAQQTIYVNGTTGDDAWDGLCEVWDGDSCGPKRTIPAGVAVAQSGDTVLVADGTYTGWENQQIQFGGRSITVRSANGPESCILDGGGHIRAFWLHEQETEAAIVQGFTITGGQPNQGGAILCQGSSPTIRECILTNNTAHQSGGGIALINSNAILEYCTLTANRANDDTIGGGGIYCFGGNPTFIHCTVTGNSAFVGAGVYVHQAYPTFDNCLIIDNLADWYGGGVFGYGPGSATFVNCTIASNAAEAYGGGLYAIDDFDPTITSCALSNNTADYGPQIALEWFSHLTAWYSDIHGGLDDVFVSTASFIHWEDGNIADEALFLDPNSGDYHLSAASPCIGAGDPGEFGIGRHDLDGEPRVMGGRVDIGVDEFTDRPFVYGDMDCDGAANGLDIYPFTVALSDPTEYEAAYPDCNVDNADINDDGSINGLDIDPFVQVLIGGGS